MPGAAAGTVEGPVTRITFQDERTGYTVLRVAGRESGPATVVGHFAAVAVGQTLRIWGRWEDHPHYGRRLAAAGYEVVAPETVVGLRRYLASGALRGVGPVLADRLVDHFGLDTLRVLEEEPERLTEVEGIGPVRARALARGIRREREARQVLVFLQGHGISPGVAAKVYRHYGRGALEKLREDPYRLADEVFGIGFKTADGLARSLGIAGDSPTRLAAGLEYHLREAAAQGHCYLPKAALLALAARTLAVEKSSLDDALAGLAEAGRAVVERAEREEAVYPAWLYRAEVAVAASLCERARGFTPPDPAVVREAERRAGLSLTPGQREAVTRALGARSAVITGGPGTGKTTVVRVLLAALARLGVRVELAAPTGRAAQRLGESAGRPARTLHRLLEFAYVEGEGPRFQRNGERPLEADAVVVDEASMVDMALLYHLLAALPRGARLVLVGDADQLPSVGPGQVLRDLIRSGAVPVARLTQIHRQAQGSLIPVNARRILRGELPVPSRGGEGDFFFLEEEDPAAVVERIRELVQRRLPAYLGCDPIAGIQVLSPMRRTPTGADHLNRVLQEALNPPAPGRPELRAGGHVLRLGDKVMQVRNDYRKLVFNGDVGRVVAADPAAGCLRVAFPQPDGLTEVEYEASDLDELAPAYCLSVHKSQGSEYPAVVLPVTTQHYLMLQRNLLYTAVTRARRLVVLVGTRRALAIAVRTAARSERHSRLAARLQAGKEAAACPSTGSSGSARS